MTEYEAEEIAFEEIRVGDRVRLTANEITHEFDVGEVIGDYIYDRTGRHYTKVNWKVERLTEPFKLPTGEWAMVAHPTNNNYVAYVQRKGSWFTLDEIKDEPFIGRVVPEETILQNIKNGYQVMSEGIGA